MRGARGEVRTANSAVETVNAAASAIASAETRASPPSSSQKRRWSSCWSMYWCFKPHNQSKRISHAVLIPETAPSTSNQSAHSFQADRSQPPTISIPFVAPPSSPASFLPSEPPSNTQSPVGIFSLTSISANICSPSGPRSIFAVGPYAHEPQLVSPPVFSTYTTEPSTAPFTPPPESIHLTTPSSPEVPYAQLLDSNLRTGDAYQKFGSSPYEFHTYQFYPGSPMGQLISPGSAISGSGTSSPFLDQELAFGGLRFTDIKFGVPPKLLNLQSVPTREWGSCQPRSGSLTPDGRIQPRTVEGSHLDRQDSTVSALPSLPNGHHNRPEAAAIDYRVSFEWTSEDVTRCVEKGSTALPRAVVRAAASMEERDDEVLSSVVYSGTEDGHLHGEDETEKPPIGATFGEEEEQKSLKQRSVSLGSLKEFNFDNMTNRGDFQKSCADSNWWANEKVSGKVEETSDKNWSFFPMIQPGAG